MERDNKLHAKYGLLTAICMVVGTVIGSGIFFKADKVLESNNGNMALSLLTVGIVGAAMLVCALVFAMLAGRYEKVNGVVDYAEATCGNMYAYGLGWFMTVLYYPTMTSTLAWISAQYTCELFGWEPTSDLHLAIAATYLIGCYAMNALSPKLAGKFQVSTTFIKLVPLAVMAVVGTIVGLCNGMTVEALTHSAVGEGSGLFAAITAFAFAYEGWVVTTSINAELKDSKKNLPRALIIGCLIVVGVYMAYFLGMTGALTTEQMIVAKNLPKESFTALFGSPVVGTVAYVFVIISCLGTMNGLMVGCSRGMYSLAARGQGPAPRVFEQVDPTTNMPVNSSVFGLLVTMLWMFQWEFGLIRGILPDIIAWENDELPIITIYAAYIPIFIIFMIRAKEVHPVKRFMLPLLGIVACAFMVYAAASAYKIQAVYYLIVFAVLMGIGMLFYRKNGKSVIDRLFRR